MAMLGNRLLNSGTDKLLPIFQNISEVFIWAYLAQDVISMVLPRILKGTFRGREKYEPSEDPNARNLPFREQAKLYLAKNFKGLNWAQTHEEITRESMAGPGLLAVLALGITAVKKLLGNSAMELSVPALEGLGQDFITHLQKAEQSLKSGEAVQLRSVVARHLDEMFIDGEFRTQHRKFLQDWIDKWADAVERHAGDTGARTRELKALSAEFEQKVWDFNRKNRLLPYAAEKIPGLDELDDKAKQALGIDAKGNVTRNLHRADQVWVRMEGKAQQKPVGELLKEMTRFSDFSGRVAEEAASAGKAFSQTARKMLERLVTRKFFTGAALTLIGGLYLMRVSKWSMSNESYQANRLLQLHKSPGGQPGAYAGNAPAVSRPVQAQPVQPAPVYQPVPNNFAVIPQNPGLPAFAPQPFNAAAYYAAPIQNGGWQR